MGSGSRGKARAGSVDLSSTRSDWIPQHRSVDLSVMESVKTSLPEIRFPIEIFPLDSGVWNPESDFQSTRSPMHFHSQTLSRRLPTG